jgi:hypothetical protein
MQNDTELQATQYQLAQFEQMMCGLRHELSPKAFAACVQGYMLEIQRMREEIDSYLLRPLQTPALASDETI